MATKKTPPRPAPTATPAPPKCGPCDGTGEVATTVHVGRKRRAVGKQAGICLACFGTGEATTD
ncbi:hypothetical protein [Streptomyces olivochromogenes]|uniref:Molecular chaperone DnaJ n=1 Tax=Streptomyces olivochromogenes TaxID=1963 RepID=A0A250V7L8_STROL|nr:hypothetical protein [Streptomyces olivochromogenes]KUN45650.1 hypothetical protein AQJ27_19235 [Streptomyces olivochromogenes]GAX50183.1 hypothetical protein SO3561_01680 [Streptomyces olivochromogenes]